jgi:hypothetical protein
MNFFDWIYCKIECICTKHRRQKQLILSPGGGYYKCEECFNKDVQKIKDRRIRLGIK